jgi:hypothetical protein
MRHGINTPPKAATSASHIVGRFSYRRSRPRTRRDSAEPSRLSSLGNVNHCSGASSGFRGSKEVRFGAAVPAGRHRRSPADDELRGLKIVFALLLKNR